MATRQLKTGTSFEVKMEKLGGKIAIFAPYGDSNRLPYESTDVECLRLLLDRWFSTETRSIVQYMYTSIQNRL